MGDKMINLVLRVEAEKMLAESMGIKQREAEKKLKSMDLLCIR